MAYTGIGARVKAADPSNSILDTFYLGLSRLKFDQTRRFIPNMPLAGKDVLIAGRTRSLLKPAETTLNFNALGTTDRTDTKVTLQPVAFELKKPQTWGAIFANDWFVDSWGSNPTYITQNTEFTSFMAGQYGPDMAQDYLRLMDLGDTAAATTPAGYLKVGVELTDYTPISGLWAQVIAAAGVTIDYVDMGTQNDQLTLALQDSTMTEAAVVAYMQAMLDKADSRLLYGEGDNAPYFLVTDFILRKLRAYYFNNQVTNGYVSAANGEQYPGADLMFQGIPVYAQFHWDRFIREDTKSLIGGATTACHLTHRMLLTNKANMLVGEVDGPGTGVDTVRVEHVTGTTSAMFMAGLQFDVKIGSHDFFVAAF